MGHPRCPLPAYPVTPGGGVLGFVDAGQINEEVYREYVGTAKRARRRSNGGYKCFLEEITIGLWRKLEVKI